MPDTPRLDNPRLLVRMADGTEHLIQTENPDMVAYDLARARMHWPAVAEAPFLWLNYLAYNKLKRSAVDVGKSFDDWVARTVKIENLGADDEPSEIVESVDPTPPAVEPV